MLGIDVFVADDPLDPVVDIPVEEDFDEILVGIEIPDGTSQVLQALNFLADYFVFFDVSPPVLG